MAKPSSASHPRWLERSLLALGALILIVGAGCALGLGWDDPITLISILAAALFLAFGMALFRRSSLSRDRAGAADDRAVLESRLRIAQDRLQLALNLTQVAIFEWDIASGHVYYSPELWTMLGYDPSAMAPTGDTWKNLIHDADLPPFLERIKSQLAGEPAHFETQYRVRAADGSWRWVHARAQVRAGPHGQPHRVVGTVRDITAQREAELALRESQAEGRKLSLVASRTDNPVIIGSTDGTIEWVNESFCRVMEYSPAEVIGRNPADFMAGPDTNPRTILKVRAAMSRGHGLSTDVVNFSKSGRKYHLHLEIQPVRDKAGKLENFIAIETDITARVETEAQLRRAKAEADAASRAKSEFLASMSHEIRTPMNGVIGMTSLLMESPLTSEQRDFVNTIRISGEALLTIINDILDFSKIESGKMELEQLPFYLVSCVEETLDLFGVQAAAKHLELAYAIEPGVPLWILGDVTRLRQVLVNLVNNAVKFTPGGSVSIEIRLAPVFASGKITLEFAVRDTGIGIPPDRLDRLFKAFSQIDSSTTRKYGGTGLGLVISQSLAALMGGTFRVESTVGKGTTFTFTIQTERVALPADEPRPLLSTAFRNGTILCIEDHPVARRRLGGLLESLQARHVFESDVKTASERVATLDPPVSLLIIDADNVDGTQLAPLAHLRVPRLLFVPAGQPLPAAPPDGEPFYALPKPAKTSAILHALVALGGTASRVPTGPGFVPPPEQLLAREFPLDVLLAEDNAVNQKVAIRFLERLGYRADAVGNGLEALAALQTRRYDLILMDLQMPEMDGLEATRQIRRLLPPERQPKIIALTANAMPGDRELCLAAGMDEYIAKPVKLSEISAAIRSLFGPQRVVTRGPGAALTS